VLEWPPEVGAPEEKLHFRSLVELETGDYGSDISSPRNLEGHRAPSHGLVGADIEAAKRQGDVVNCLEQGDNQDPRGREVSYVD